jgi:hydrogenase nickel incorporation protein HypA/HybF
MHEIGICESVLAAVEQRAGDRAVAAITVRIGTMLRVVPEAFAQSFEMVAAGTVAEGATPELIIEPVQGSCEQCGDTFESRDHIPSCPSCGSIRVTRQGGDELMLESIAYRAGNGAAAERS